VSPEKKYACNFKTRPAYEAAPGFFEARFSWTTLSIGKNYQQAGN
jgi:hypothetical protein